MNTDILTQKEKARLQTFGAYVKKQQILPRYWLILFCLCILGIILRIYSISLIMILLLASLGAISMLQSKVTKPLAEIALQCFDGTTPLNNDQFKFLKLLNDWLISRRILTLYAMISALMIALEYVAILYGLKCKISILILMICYIWSIYHMKHFYLEILAIIKKKMQYLP